MRDIIFLKTDECEKLKVDFTSTKEQYDAQIAVLSEHLCGQDNRAVLAGIGLIMVSKYIHGHRMQTLIAISLLRVWGNAPYRVGRFYLSISKIPGPQLPCRKTVARRSFLFEHFKIIFSRFAKFWFFFGMVIGEGGLLK